MPTGDLSVRRQTVKSAEGGPGKDQAAGPALLRALFPAAPAPGGARGDSRRAAVARRTGVVATHVAALAAGIVVMLARIPGRPAWATIYNEDLTVYLPDALARPWHLLIPYGGYVQLAPRVVAQLAALLPLRHAAKVFALAGALVAAACAVVVFHASAGHIRSVTLRVLAGAAVLLLPVASLEIADSTVNALWYLILALFWAVLWRPRTRSGMAAAAAVAFLAASAQPLVLVFAPLFAARVAVLRRLRDHTVTIGWAAGLAVQLSSLHHAQSRATQTVPVGKALAFYAHGVVQPALGWHIGWWLQSAAGRDGATVIVGVALAALFGCALLAIPAGPRVFIAVALLTGFVFTVVSSDLGYGWARIGPEPTLGTEKGSRYTTLALFLIDCAGIVAVDALIRRRAAIRRDDKDGLDSPGRSWPRRLAPVLALVAVLSAGWATDFRFMTTRAQAATWAASLARWEHSCAKDPAGTVRVKQWDLPGKGSELIPCARIRRKG